MADPRFGNHAPDWEPTSDDVPATAPGVEEVIALGKVEAKRQSQEDMRAAFGPPKVVIKDADTGEERFVDEDSPEAALGAQLSWQVDMRDPANRGKYRELSNPHREALKERSRAYNQGNRKVAMRHMVTGEERLVFEEVEDDVGREAGFVRSMIGGGFKIHRGPDGMLFRLVSGGWVPTGRTCLGTPLSGDGIARGVQRDPSGASWVVNEHGEWETTAALYERKVG